MNDCIFCKIVAGEIPAERVYEDSETLAFLDIHPTTPGHTLIIPKKHMADVCEADSHEIAAVMKSVQYLAPAILKATGATGFNVFMNNGAAAGQVIFHWHTHVIPRMVHDGLRPWGGTSYASGEAAELAENIKSHLT